jgi:hypothetical protein
MLTFFILAYYLYTSDILAINNHCSLYFKKVTTMKAVFILSPGKIVINNVANRKILWKLSRRCKSKSIKE